MTTSLVDAESLLALDIGVATTRASLFDVADGRYRFIAQGQAPTTAGAPFKDLLEGIRLAVERLEEVTGRTLNGTDDRLLVPSLTDGSGVDRVVATLSVGDALSTVVVGLLDDVSLESAHRLVNTSYTRLAESIGLNDRRKMEAQVDAILQASPQVIVVAGGT
ncbi:MAG: glutamate mutase L, partial [Anaerolineaceae bacterium]